MSASISPVAWYGGKSRLSARIVTLLPRHDSYIECFGGGASVLFRKAPAKLEVYNDTDRGLVTFFRMLRDRPAELQRALTLTPYARAEYEHCRDTWRTVEDELELARRWYVRTRMAFACSPTSGWGFEVDGGQRGGSRCASFATAVDGLARFAERFRRVQVEQLDWRKCLERYDRPGAVLYLDPPYHPDRRGKDRHNAYQHDLDTSDHEELVRRVKVVRNRVLKLEHKRLRRSYSGCPAPWWALPGGKPHPPRGTNACHVRPPSGLGRIIGPIQGTNVTVGGGKNPQPEPPTPAPPLSLGGNPTPPTTSTNPCDGQTNGTGQPCFLQIEVNGDQYPGPEEEYGIGIVTVASGTGQPTIAESSSPAGGFPSGSWASQFNDDPGCWNGDESVGECYDFEWGSPQTVTLTAYPIPEGGTGTDQPSYDSQFVSWGGDCADAGSSTTCTLQIDSQTSDTGSYGLSVVAYFQATTAAVA